MLNCSSATAFNEDLRNLKRHFLNRGYGEHFIDDCLMNVTFTDRHRVLQDNILSSCKRTIFSTLHQPGFYRLRQCLSDDWHLLDTTLSNHIFQRPPMIAHRRNKNLKNHLVRTVLPALMDLNMTPNHTEEEQLFLDTINTLVNL